MSLGVGFKTSQGPTGEEGSVITHQLSPYIMASFGGHLRHLKIAVSLTRELSRNSMADCQSKSICRMPVNSLPFSFSQGYIFGVAWSCWIRANRLVLSAKPVEGCLSRGMFVAPSICSRLQHFPGISRLMFGG